MTRSVLAALSVLVVGATIAGPRAATTDAGASCRYRLLKSFGKPGPGGFPSAKLLQASDGALYGTTQIGGSNDYGTVFKLNLDGTGFTALVRFDNGTTGAHPFGKLIEGTDGALYGTTSEGGTGGLGTVFKVNTDGTSFTVLENFVGVATGSHPYTGLVQGLDGVLYGTASEGGSNGTGTLFKLNTDGTGFSVLKNFDGLASGAYPYAELMQSADGKLYGAASFGGSNDLGAVFGVNTDGTGYTILQSFDGAGKGAFPYAGLVQGADGALFGAASEGGINGDGTIFKINPDGSAFAVLKHFAAASTGRFPAAALIQGSDGALYGTTSYLGGPMATGTVFKLNPDGSGFAVLAPLGYVPLGDDYLNAGLIQATNGALYGTTPEGPGSTGAGQVFRLNPDGSGFAFIFQHFSRYPDTSDGGGHPIDALLRGSDGALYGTNYDGGSAGWGTVFKLNPDGTGFTVLKNFDFGTAGGHPSGALIEGMDGALYGTASSGGLRGFGTVFKLNHDGSGFATLLHFDRFLDGAAPRAGLIQGADGALYGTTRYGGGNSDSGTVFRMNVDGTGFTVLKYFGGLSGASPAPLLQGLDGALYGTTSSGASGGGTVFKLNTDGSGFNVLKTLSTATGFDPFAGLIQGDDRALYGTTGAGGAYGLNGGGTVFKLNPDGSGFTVLRSFDIPVTGGRLSEELLVGADGALYGTAPEGGSADSGTLFKLNPDGSDFEVLMNFGPITLGAPPSGKLIQGANGLMYGVVRQGGTVGAGGVFSFDPFVDHNPPQARCQDVTIFAGANCTGDASIDAGSSDPDASDRITISQEPAGPYPVGDTQVTLTVTDRGCMTSTCFATVTIPAGTPCNDGNACTMTDTCQSGQGCVGANPTLCQPSDTCHEAGTCDPSTRLCSSPPRADGTVCDDASLCTTGETCQAGTCTPTFDGLNHPTPKSAGYYERLCKKRDDWPYRGDLLTNGDAVCVAGLTATFDYFATVDDICYVLDDHHGGSHHGGDGDGPDGKDCDKAENELIATALNICRARACEEQNLDSHCHENTHTSVAQSFGDADAILDDAGRTQHTCKDARCELREINNGHALEMNSLTLSIENNQVRLRWLAPVLDDGSGTPSLYELWRRPAGSSQPFAKIGTTTGLTFLDATAGTADWEYDLTAVIRGDS